MPKIPFYGGGSPLLQKIGYVSAASVMTGAIKTLRLSGLEEDINTSGCYQALKPRLLAMDRVAEADQIRWLLASPDVVVGSVAALPLESARSQSALGWPSAVNGILILNAEFKPGRGTVLLLRSAIGF